MIISLMVSYSLELPFNLPLMTLLGIISSWASIGAVVVRRRQVSKIVTWQVAILSLPGRASPSTTPSRSFC